MMLRRLFGGGSKDKDKARKVEHAWDLSAGDFLKFGFVAPHGLSTVEARVASVRAIDLGGPHKVRRVLTLDDGGGYDMWRDDDGALALARTIGRPDVERLFDLDEFARLFDPDEPANLVLHRRAELPEFEGWTTEIYRQEAALQAYHHEQDPAVTKIDTTLADDAEAFDHYRLVGDRRRFAVEVAVFDGGRTDVTLVALMAESVVEEFWVA